MAVGIEPAVSPFFGVLADTSITVFPLIKNIDRACLHSAEGLAAHLLNECRMFSTYSPFSLNESLSIIELNLNMDGTQVNIHYPDDYREREGFVAASYPLEDIKANGALAKELLEGAFSMVFEEVEGVLDG